MMDADTIAALERVLEVQQERGYDEPLIRALIERNRQPPIVRIDPAQYEDGLYLNPITGAVMWIAAFPPVGGGHAK